MFNEHEEESAVSRIRDFVVRGMRLACTGMSPYALARIEAEFDRRIDFILFFSDDDRSQERRDADFSFMELHIRTARSVLDDILGQRSVPDDDPYGERLYDDGEP